MGRGLMGVVRVYKEVVSPHLGGRCRFVQGDLFGPVQECDRPFDVVCANPPYVEDEAWDRLSPVIRLHEDPHALLAGPDGLDVVRRIAKEARGWLRPGGMLALEIGMGQYGAVEALLAHLGYDRVESRADLAGIRRIVVATRGQR